MSLFYILKAITNLHVGSGEGNYSIVDKQVERDEVSGYPTIYSSSLKGALREHFKTQKLASLQHIFGSESGNQESFSGEVKFFEGKLLAMPMRASAGTQSSYLVTTVELIEEFLQFLVLSGERVDDAVFGELEGVTSPVKILKDEVDVAVEGISIPDFLAIPALTDILLKALGTQTVIVLPTTDFHTIQLPIRARNNLGDNKNLWYEEHVPYGSVFYTMMLSNSFDGDSKALGALEQALAETKFVQVGANASIGFGLVSLEKWEG